jgi:dihydrofolate reductase
MSKPYDLLLGRKTYEIFASHWPFAKDPMAEGLNKAKKYVASKALTKLEWNNSELLNGDVATQVRKLKELDGPVIQVHGSGDLVQTLLRYDLVDEFRLKIFPITLGKGKRLFAAGTIAAGFKLVESDISPGGVIVVTYRRAKEVRIGNAQMGTPSQAELERRKALSKEA